MSRLTRAVRTLMMLLPAALAAPLVAQAPAAPAPPPALKISGFADVSYVYSNNATGDSVIAGRLYDRFQNHFMLNAFELVVDKPYDAAKLSAGVHADVLFGQDAALIKSGGFDLGGQGDLPDLYVTLNLPTKSGNGLQIKAGRIPTLLGLEVIETNANPNWSEGNQFVYVENFTGLGLSVETKFNPHLDAQLRIFNGWDLVHDNNTTKSFMGRVGLYPDTLSSIGVTAYWGPEEATNDTSKRYGGEILLWRKFGKTNLWLQGDYGKEQANPALPDPTQDAKWSAFGAWLTYDFSGTATIALRGDYVDDANGARTNGFLGFPANTGQKFWSGTATINIRAWPNALVRPELRYDHSDVTPGPFDGNSSQVSVAVGVAYSF